VVADIQERHIDDKESKEFVVFDNNTIFIERIHGRISVTGKIKRKSNIAKPT